MMAIELGYAVIRDIFLDTMIFNTAWLLSALLTFITLLALSRDANRWKELAFPVMVGWHIAGVPPFFLLYIAAAIMFGIECLSLQFIGEALTLIKVPRSAEKKPDKLAEIYKRENLRVKRKEVKEMFKTTGPMPDLDIDDILKRAKGKK